MTLTESTVLNLKDYMILPFDIRLMSSYRVDHGLPIPVGTQLMTHFQTSDRTIVRNGSCDCFELENI